MLLSIVRALYDEELGGMFTGASAVEDPEDMILLVEKLGGKEYTGVLGMEADNSSMAMVKVFSS